MAMAKMHAKVTENTISTAETTPKKSCLKPKYFLKKSSTVVLLPLKLIVPWISPYCDATNPYKDQATGFPQ